MRLAPDGSPVELYRRLPERTAGLAVDVGLRIESVLDDAATMLALRPWQDH